jgi:hypothetical protein
VNSEREYAVDNGNTAVARIDAPMMPIAKPESSQA